MSLLERHCYRLSLHRLYAAAGLREALRVTTREALRVTTSEALL